MSVDRAVARLERLLQEERILLLRGDLQRLGPLVPRKEKLLRALITGPDDRPGIARLRALSERNQTLLQAAQRGIGAARTRLDQIARGTPVGTYSRTGEKTQIARPVQTLQRRA